VKLKFLAPACVEGLNQPPAIIRPSDTLWIVREAEALGLGPLADPMIVRQCDAVTNPSSPPPASKNPIPQSHEAPPLQMPRRWTAAGSRRATTSAVALVWNRFARFGAGTSGYGRSPSTA
jgi:hypothetical protein